MKSYDEMAQSVLIRAEKEKMMQKRRNRNIVLSVIAGVCCLTCAILVGMRLNTPEPQTPMLNDVTVPTSPEPSTTETDPISKESHEITLLSLSEDGTYVQMMNDVVVPYYLQLWVRDVRGLTEEEVQKAKLAEEDIANGLIKEPFEYASISQGWGKDIILTVLSIGRITVAIDDFEQVEDFSITSTGTGHLDIGKMQNNNPDNNTSPGKLFVYWRPSEEVTGKLEEDPYMKLSEICDTISITIKFKDGAVGTAVVDLIFDDEGIAYITQRGITVN